jgi:uncharacterized membrane protein (DUF485 family)
MNRTFRPSFWILSGIAAIAGVLAIVTAFAPDWIEVAFGWDPDLHDGSVERSIIIGLCCVTALSFILAALAWRRAPAELT